MMPTAKYPNKAMMKRMQQRTSVQPLRGEKCPYRSCRKDRYRETEGDSSPVVNRPLEVRIKLPGLP